MTNTAFDGENYTTIVVRHPDHKSAYNFFQEMADRFPPDFQELSKDMNPPAASDVGRLTMATSSDVGSITYAANMVLDAPSCMISKGDAIELTLMLLERCHTPESCLELLRNWDLSIRLGGLVVLTDNAETSQ